jgi:hypothetical protein
VTPSAAAAADAADAFEEGRKRTAPKKPPAVTLHADAFRWPAEAVVEPRGHGVQAAAPGDGA